MDLPDEVRLPGWTGPSVFTPSDRDGALVTLGEFAPALHRDAHAGWRVIGTIREADAPAPSAYAAFCASPETGHIVLVDLDGSGGTRFVNSDLDAFRTSLAMFVAEWPRIVAAGAASAPASAAVLRSCFAAIDPAAMTDEDSVWSLWLEELAAD